MNQLGPLYRHQYVFSSPAAKRIVAAGEARQREVAVAALKAKRAAEEARWAAALAAAKPLPPSTAEEAAQQRLGACRAIIEEVARKHRYAAAELWGERRNKQVVAARQEAMFRCFVETTQSLGQIARAFGRDHTTIGYGVATYARRHGLPMPRGMQWHPKVRP